jgi:DNA adenine methylase
LKRPALKYYGAKWNLAPWIISHFPKHDNYIEPCGGTAAVLLQKQPSALEVFNDLDSNVVNFFRVLRDRQDELIEKIKLTPYAREEFEYCRQRSNDELENARRFFVGCWMSISCTSFDKTSGWRSTSYWKQLRVIHVVSYKSAIENLYHVADRFKYVQIENRPAQYVIERYDNKDSLIYFDPPYVKETRSQKNQYNLEVDNQFHIDCAELLKQCKGAVIVSGYNCELYEQLYGNWQRFDKEVLNNSGNKRIESIWLSPNIPYVKQERLF